MRRAASWVGGRQTTTLDADFCPARTPTSSPTPTPGARLIMSTPTGPSTLRARRVRVYTRMSHPLRKRLLAYCGAAGRSERAVIEDAVDRFLADPSKDASAAGPIDRLAQAIDDDRRLRERQHRDFELLAQMFGRFLQLWTIVHASEGAEAIVKQRGAGEALYRRLAASVADQFRRGHRFADDLPNVDDRRPERVDKP